MLAVHHPAAPVVHFAAALDTVATCRVNYPPSEDETAEEVEMLVSGMMRVAPGIPEALDLHADNAVFQNVQTVNFYITLVKA